LIQKRVEGKVLNLMKTNDDVNAFFHFSSRRLLITLGILVSVFVFNPSALSEINCQNLVNESPQESPQGMPLFKDAKFVVRENLKKYRKGYCYIKLEKFDDGLRLLGGLENELSLIPDYVIYYRAVGEKGLGNMTGAARDFYKILTNYPESGLRRKVLLGLAEAYYGVGYYEGAEKTLRILYGEESQPSARAIVLYKIGESLEGERKYIEAINTYRELWVEFPESEFADVSIGKGFQISQREGIPFELKESEYVRRAERLFKLSRWKSALENFDKVSEKTDDIKLKMAISKYRLGLIDEASDILVQIKTPESLYWMSKISLKLGRDEEAAETLSQIPLLYPQSKLAPEALFSAAKLYQINLNSEKALELYDLLLRNYPKSEFAEDAAWNIGWIHYRSGRYTEAAVTFSSINSPQSTYWKARALEKEGRNQEALSLYKSLARMSPRSYYSYLAERKTGFVQSPSTPLGLSTKDDLIKEESPGENRARFLIELGIFEDATLEIKEMEKKAKSQRELLYVSELYNKANDFYSSIKIADKLNFPEAVRLSYPIELDGLVRELSAKYDMDEFLVYSIIREESRFQKNAVSPSGAIGLMQLIPSTGKSTATKVGIRGYRADMLYIPDVNIELGTAYFKEVLGEFEGNVAFALASYNGGPNNVARWIAKLGNLDMDEFVEEIPFYETKNYVKKVLKSYGAYKAIYNNEGH
jgi:peptidoglycan lytic transglycosylase